jgi:hypothetical protein
LRSSEIIACSIDFEHVVMGSIGGHFPTARRTRLGIAEF